MSDTKHIRLFNRDGTSQQQRRPVEIDPLYAKIDDRQLKDLLSFLWRMAEHIHYYNLHNSKNGHWQDFVGVEQAVMLSLIAAKDTTPLHHAYLKLQSEISETNEKNAYLPLFNLFRDHFVEFKELYDNTRRILDKELFLSRRNTRLLTTCIQKLLNLYMSYKDYQIDSCDGYIKQFKSFCDDMGLEYKPPKQLDDLRSMSPDELDDKMSNDLYDLHQDLQKLFETIIGHAGKMLDETLKRQGDFQPHIGLILTFLRLFEHYQDQLNNLTARHLKFYYQDVLKIQYREKIADRVFVIIQLAKHADICRLEKGTVFKAGKDSEGKNLFYEAAQEFVANKAQVADLKSVYRYSDNLADGKTEQKIANTDIVFKSVKAAIKADSKNGVDEELDKDNPQFPPFGNDEVKEYAQLGFAFASPVLRLSGGERTVTILLEIKNDSLTETVKEAFLNVDLNDLFEIHLSCEKDWEEFSSTSGKAKEFMVDFLENTKNPQIQIQFILDSSFPGIVDFSKEVHSGLFAEEWPVCKVVLKDNENENENEKKNKNYYELCRHLPVVNCKITTQVSGLKNLVLQNDFGLQKPEKPIMIFGNAPKPKAAFYIGSQEVFAKRLDTLSVKWEWIDFKNESQLSEWYDNYKLPVSNITEDKNGNIVELPNDVKSKLSDEVIVFLTTYANAVPAIRNIGEERIKTFLEDSDSFDVILAAYTKQIVQSIQTVLAIGYDERERIIAFLKDSGIFDLAVHAIWTTCIDQVIKAFQSLQATQGLSNIIGEQIKSTLQNETIFRRANSDISDIYFNRVVQAIQALYTSTFPTITITFDRLVGNQWEIVANKVDTTTVKKWEFLKDEPCFKMVFDNAMEDTYEQVHVETNKFKELDAFKKYTSDLSDGFIRINLENEDMEGEDNNFLFGHEQYSTALMKSLESSVTINNDGNMEVMNEIDPVNPPIIPMIQNVELGYTSSVGATSEEESILSEEELEFFHLHPFGISSKGNPNEAPKPRLVCNLDAEGYFYIGLKALMLPQNISLLFQFVEGTGYLMVDMPEKVNWYYLAEHGWQEFDERGVLSDGTREFSGTGIISFSIPVEAVDNSTIMPTGYHWIRASVSNRSRAVNMLASVQAQAMELEFDDHDNAADHYEAALPAGIISKLLQSRAEVKTVAQPFASFGGRPRESRDTYFVRVSERLRHKDRAVTLWDYERLVLENFPQIHKVKCLNHTREDCEIAPGHVKVVVIPKLTNLNAVNILKPAVSRSLKNQIMVFLKERCSSFVKLHVDNPKYDELRITAKVIFRTGEDEGYCNYQLSEDIKDFLTPWKRNPEDIHFYETLHSSVILNFIEERKYVDYLTSFTVDKMDRKTVESSVVLGDIVRSYADSLFVSAEKHLINDKSESEIEPK